MTAFELDAVIDGLARRQHGVFARRQVFAAGVTPRMIDRRLDNGRWLRLLPSVYALPSHPGTWKRAVMAAVLAETYAVADGRSAAVLQEVPDFRPGRPEIVVPADAHARSSTARVRRRSEIHSVVIDHIPVLDLCDTLHMLAGTVDRPKVEPALDHLLAHGRLTIEELQRRHLSLAGSRRPGLGHMRRLIEVRSVDGYEPPESELERHLYGILDRPGMPPHVRQPPLPWDADRRADAMVPSARLILEADGRAWHARMAAFADDRLRDRLATRYGFATLRFTHHELTTAPDWVAAEIVATVRSAPRQRGALTTV